MYTLSKRASKIAPSSTLIVAERARELRKNGKNIISFAMGEPDFDTPDDIKQEAVQAMKDGFTKYTNTTGIDELKEAITSKFMRDNKLSYQPSQIIISTGAKQVVYNTLSVICNENDEVIIIAPCWVSYAEQVRLVDAKPVFVYAEGKNNFIPCISDIESKISGRTKAIIINSPNNPSGAVYPESFLSELAVLIKKHGLLLISDEVYEKLIFEDSRHYCIVSVDPDLKESVVIINGVSKTYSMTGWRIGYGAGPLEIISAMGKVQGHITGNATSIAQKAATYAININYDYGSWIPQYNKRRKYCLEVINKIPGVSCVEPKGAFYLFPDVTGLIGRSYGSKVIETSLDLAEYLLEEAYVAVVPGEAFELTNHIRLSYATSMINIETGMDSIARAIRRLN